MAKAYKREPAARLRESRTLVLAEKNLISIGGSVAGGILIGGAVGGGIAGGAIGGVVGLVAGIALCRQRRSKAG